MNRWMMLAASAALACASVAGAAAGKTLEERCQAEAAKHKIAADKLDAYVKACVEKHHLKHKAIARHDSAPSATTPPSSPAKSDM